MIRLSGSDAFHLHREDDGQPAHTMKVAVLSPGPAVLDADQVAAWARAALPGRAPFCWRLQTVPLGRPGWVDAEHVDAGHHVVRHTLQRRSLEDLVGDLAGDRLDRARPLWRLWVVDGIAEGEVALVLQLHHALADGVASVRLWEEVFGAAPAELPAGPVPTNGALLAGALRHHLGNLRTLPSLLGRLRAAEAAKSARPVDDAAADYLQAPPTVFNDVAAGPRVARTVGFDLDDLRVLARRLDGTVNDLYATVCAGALRGYLLDHDALPDRPLTASAPVALERPPSGYGNAMSSWFFALATDVADPRDRFAAVQASLRAGREVQQADPALLADLQEHSRLYESIWWGLARAERGGERPLLNLTVSNVRGPDPLTWQGHPVTELWSLGPLAGRIGLNLTAWSYGEDFTVGLHACRDQLPDLSRLAELLVAELDVLLAAGQREG